MKAIRAHEYGGPDAMRTDELPAPTPGAGQALVRIEAAGVNFIDVYQRSGQYKTALPVPLGLEAAGVVEALGPGTTGVAVGQRVAWNGVPGSYATHVAVPVDRVVGVPDGVDARSAAAAMLQGMTAHYLARSTFALKEGDTCLVHAAAGGVGLLLCQIAKRAGARVLGTTSTEEKAEQARAAGADEIILYTKEDFVAKGRELTKGRGVDVVYDSVGKDTFLRGLDLLRPRGLMVLYGQSSGAVAPFDPQLLNTKGSLFVTRPNLAHHVAAREELVARAGEVLSWIARGDLKIHIGATFPLDKAADAHRALEGRKTTGKVLLLP
jgi:NADPH2:quinone reductase